MLQGVLEDMNVGVRASDERRFEVVAQDVPLFRRGSAGVLSSSGELTPMRLMCIVLCWRVLGPITCPELLTGRC